MKNEWLILPQDHANPNEKDMDMHAKLLDIMNQIDDGRGWRFTKAQANTLTKLVDSLIEQVKAQNKERNKNRKRRGTLFL